MEHTSRLFAVYEALVIPPLECANTVQNLSSVAAGMGAPKKGISSFIHPCKFNI